MNFIHFCIRLLISGFVAIFLYSIGIFIFALPLLAIGYLKERLNKILLYFIGFILAIPIIIFNLYFWGLWAAYCVSLSYSYIGREGVEYNWLYWITGFFTAVSLIGWLEYKERSSAESESEFRSIGRGSLLWKIILILFFIVFAIAPKLMDLPYGIFLERLVPNSEQISESEINNLDSDDLLEQGIYNLNNGKYEDAVLILNKAIDKDPSNIEAFVARGSAKTFTGNHEGAIQDFDKVIDLNPSSEQAYYLRGNSESYLGNAKKGMEDFNKAIEINPNFAMAYFGRGYTKSMKMDFRGAIEDYDKAIELNFDDKFVYGGRGVSKHMLGDYKGAFEDCNKAIEMDPKYAEAYACRGMAKVSLGQTNDGCLDMSKSKEMGFRKVESFINRMCK